MSQYARENAWYLEDVDVDELLIELEALNVTSISTKPPIYPRTPSQKSTIETAVNSSANTSTIFSPVHPRSTALLPQCGWFAGKTEFAIQSVPGDAFLDRPTTARPSHWKTPSEHKKTVKHSIFQAAATTNFRQQSSQSRIGDSVESPTDSFNL